METNMLQPPSILTEKDLERIANRLAHAKTCIHDEAGQTPNRWIVEDYHAMLMEIALLKSKVMAMTAKYSDLIGD